MESIAQAEEKLMRRINRGLPEDLRGRYDDLVGKRSAENLSSDEHRELLQLSDKVEEEEVNRIQALAELARLRGTPLADLLTLFSIGPHAHHSATRKEAANDGL